MCNSFFTCAILFRRSFDVLHRHDARPGFRPVRISGRLYSQSAIRILIMFTVPRGLVTENFTTCAIIILRAVLLPCTTIA